MIVWKDVVAVSPYWLGWATAHPLSGKRKARQTIPFSTKHPRRLCNKSSTMSNSPDNGASNEEDPLKPALWSALGQITDSTLALNYGTNASPQFIGALTEMVYAQLQNTALEIEAFARYVSSVSRGRTRRL